MLSSVQEAERRTAEALADGTLDKEYLPIEGDAAFRTHSARLVFGVDSAPICSALNKASSPDQPLLLLLRFIAALQSVYRFDFVADFRAFDSLQQPPIAASQASTPMRSAPCLGPLASSRSASTRTLTHYSKIIV